MADVFLSYAREDKERAEQIAQAMEAAGLDVFWDNEIPPGTTWADFIEQKLTQARALIVLWSEESTRSQWVREEARLGRDKGVLIPVMIDKCQAPFGFGEVQAADLSDWAGNTDDPRWRRFIEAARNRAAAAPQPAPMPAPPAPSYTLPPVAQAPSGPRKGPPIWVWGAAAAAVAVIAIAVIGAISGPKLQPPQQQAAFTPQQSTTGAPSTQPNAQGGQAAYAQQIAARLGQVEQALGAQGFVQVVAPTSGQLNAGQVQNVPVTLNVGGDYRIVGVCDDDCGDLDLILYDQNNNIVSQDSAADATPVVIATPQWTGLFTVQVVMHNCAVAPCYYALALYDRVVQRQ